MRLHHHHSTPVQALPRTPDQMISAILAVEQEMYPNSDAGAITIDSRATLHVVFQKGRILGYGGSIQEALESALGEVQEVLAVFRHK